MNEKIKLPAQEWLGYDPERGDMHGYTFEQMKKFAELIVRECEQVSLKHSHRDDDMGAIIARHIKEHFGVEQ